MSEAIILIPAFNNATTIVATLKSIQSQSIKLSSFVSAVYLADDGSTDNTISLAESSWNHDVPLRILSSSQNVGERGNVNRAIELVEEPVEWILIIHSDDLAKPNWIEIMMRYIVSCDSMIGSVCSSWDVLLPNGIIIQGEDDLSRNVEVISGTQQATIDTLLRGCWWHISGCAIRRQAIDAIGGFDVNLPQLGDWEWLLRCLYQGWSVAYIPRTLVLYRQHQASVSSKSFQIDQDVRESLMIIRKYSTLLSQRQLLLLHLRRVYYVLRRMLRALTRRSKHRVVMASQTLVLIVHNFMICWPVAGKLSEANER